MRLAIICLLCLASLGAAQSQPPNVIESARRSIIAAFPALDAAEPAVARHGVAATTALGCRLIDGVPLVMPIDVYRLEFQLDGAPLPVHVAADGSMTQPCDERFPNLGEGVQPLPRARLDSDGDGLDDSADICPLIAGIFAPERAGCPLPSDHDRDGDGAPDETDRCPNQAGAAASGCSLMRDEDGDGVPDHVDVCRANFGVIRDDFALGCPADGGGSSSRRRGNDDVCLAVGDAPIFASRYADAEIAGMLSDGQDQAVVGRTAANDWLQLAGGWVKRAGLGLRGACFNIPLVNPAAGGATGCFIRPRDGYANVRQGPAGKQVTRIYGNRSYAALGANVGGDWLFYRGGWVNRAVLELAGNCEALPTLDPSRVASGVVHFCPPDYSGLLRPRIEIGERNARVASATVANRLRAAPDVSAEQIGDIPGGALLNAVLDGPACNGTRVWWQVEVEGQVGWTVESDLYFNYYYLEPVASERAPGHSASDPSVRAPSPRPQPPSGRMIHSSNASAIDTISILSAKSTSPIAWSRDGLLAAIDRRGAFVFYQPAESSQGIKLKLPAQASPAAIAFNPAGSHIALGESGGAVSVFEITQALGATQTYRLEPLAGPVRALAFSGAGDRLAAISGDENLKLARKAGTLKLWRLDPTAPLVSDPVSHYRFPYPLTALAFSADDRLLAVTGESLTEERAGLWVYRLADVELLFSKALIPMAGGARVVASPDLALGDFVYSHGDSLYQLRVDSGEDRRLFHRAGELLPVFAFRRQVLPDAEALLAVASIGRNGAARLRIVNPLNPHAPVATLDVAASQIAFSPDSRALAIVERAQDQVLILGATQG